MKQIKTSELTGMALDYCVAVCEGFTNLRKNPHAFCQDLIMTCPRKEYGNAFLDDLTPSSDWSQGGPIIEREKISVWLHEGGNAFRAAPEEWMLADPESEEFINMADSVIGHTPLIAAMRCYVASKLGDVVSVPDGLAQSDD